MIRIRRKLHILGETGKGHKINLHKIGARKKFAEAQEILVSVRNAKGSLKLLARGGGVNDGRFRPLAFQKRA